MIFLSLRGLDPNSGENLDSGFVNHDNPYLVLNISFANKRFWVSFEYGVYLFDKGHHFKKLFDAGIRFFSVSATISEEDFFSSFKNCKTRYNLYLALMSFDPDKHRGLSANYFMEDKTNLVFGLIPNNDV